MEDEKAESLFYHLLSPYMPDKVLISTHPPTLEHLRVCSECDLKASIEEDELQQRDAE